MLKIITKSAHNALLYQIEDLKKKLEMQTSITQTYKDDINTFLEQREDAKDKIGQISLDLNNTKKKYELCASRHKSAALRNEKLQKANTSLLSKNESLTAENHRLGNLLQVKCDEVNTLEKKIKEVEKEEKLSTDIIGEIEYHVLHALKSIDVPATRKPKNVMHAIKLLRDALKPLQEIN